MRSQDSTGEVTTKFVGFYKRGCFVLETWRGLSARGRDAREPCPRQALHDRRAPPEGTRAGSPRHRGRQRERRAESCEVHTHQMHLAEPHVRAHPGHPRPPCGARRTHQGCGDRTLLQARPGRCPRLPFHSGSSGIALTRSEDEDRPSADGLKTRTRTIPDFGVLSSTFSLSGPSSPDPSIVQREHGVALPRQHECSWLRGALAALLCPKASRSGT